jgi:hypothetical protein
VGPVLNRQIGDAAEFAFIIRYKRQPELKKKLLDGVLRLPTFDFFGRRIVPAFRIEILRHGPQRFIGPHDGIALRRGSRLVFGWDALCG